MSFAVVQNVAELRRAIARARADGAASLTVPFFGASSAAFDEVVSEGSALRYTLVVELSLPVPGDVR